MLPRLRNKVVESGSTRDYILKNYNLTFSEGVRTSYVHPKNN